MKNKDFPSDPDLVTKKVHKVYDINISSHNCGHCNHGKDLHTHAEFIIIIILQPAITVYTVHQLKI